jgi:transcriptional regulator with XRE-family HTH domain
VKRWSGLAFSRVWKQKRALDRTLSARRLAGASGVWPQTVYNWATKHSKPPTFDQVLALASELDVDPEAFTE